MSRHLRHTVAVHYSCEVTGGRTGGNKGTQDERFKKKSGWRKEKQQNGNWLKKEAKWTDSIRTGFRSRKLQAIKSELRGTEEGLWIHSSMVEQFFCYVKGSICIPGMAHSCPKESAFWSFPWKSLGHVKKPRKFSISSLASTKRHMDNLSVMPSQNYIWLFQPKCF